MGSNRRQWDVKMIQEILWINLRVKKGFWKRNPTPVIITKKCVANLCMPYWSNELKHHKCEGALLTQDDINNPSVNRDLALIFIFMHDFGKWKPVLFHLKCCPFCSLKHLKHFKLYISIHVQIFYLYRVYIQKAIY